MTCFEYVHERIKESKLEFNNLQIDDSLEMRHIFSVEREI